VWKKVRQCQRRRQNHQPRELIDYEIFAAVRLESEFGLAHYAIQCEQSDVDGQQRDLPITSRPPGKFNSRKCRFKPTKRMTAMTAVTAHTTQTTRVLIRATRLTRMNGTKMKRFSNPTSSVESYQIRRPARKIAVATRRIS